MTSTGDYLYWSKKRWTRRGDSATGTASTSRSKPTTITANTMRQPVSISVSMPWSPWVPTWIPETLRRRSQSFAGNRRAGASDAG